MLRTEIHQISYEFHKSEFQAEIKIKVYSL